MHPILTTQASTDAKIMTRVAEDKRLPQAGLPSGEAHEEAADFVAIYTAGEEPVPQNGIVDTPDLETQADAAKIETAEDTGLPEHSSSKVATRDEASASDLREISPASQQKVEKPHSKEAADFPKNATDIAAPTSGKNQSNPETAANALVSPDTPLRGTLGAEVMPVPRKDGPVLQTGKMVETQPPVWYQGVVATKGDMASPEKDINSLDVTRFVATEDVDATRIASDPASDKAVAATATAEKSASAAQNTIVGRAQPQQAPMPTVPSTPPPLTSVPLINDTLSAPQAKDREKVLLPSQAVPPPSEEAPPTIVTRKPTTATMAQTVVFASMEGRAALPKDAPAALQGEPADLVPWDLRTSHTPASITPSAIPLAQRAELPPHVAQQLAVAMQKAPDKPVEIALNPPELGRVRMVMNASETGVVVQVLTERTDTLDMMRRNIDELGRALSDLGYEDISFSFGQDSSADQQTGDDGDTPEVLRLDVEDTRQPNSNAHAHIPTLALAPDSIDIRL